MKFPKTFHDNSNMIRFILISLYLSKIMCRIAGTKYVFSMLIEIILLTHPSI